MLKIVALLATLAVSVNGQYTVGLNTTAPAGYRMATLAEIQSPGFLTLFNKMGGLPDAGETMIGCCVFQIAEGYLSIGGTLFTAFTSAGVYQCTQSLQAPVAFGGAVNDGPYASQFFGSTLNSTFLSQTTTMPDFSALPGCSSSSASWAIYSNGAPPPPPPGPNPPGPPPPPGPAGQYTVGLNSTTPPGFAMASLTALQTQDFVTFFNKMSGLPDAGETMIGCCVFQVAEGYLSISGTFFTAYTSTGTRECSQQLQAPVAFGGAVQSGSPYSEQFFGSMLNTTFMGQVSTQPTFTTLPGCESSTASWAIYASGAPPPPSPGPSPPGPPPPPGPPGCSVDPAVRKDCGYTLTQPECLAKGCCYDDSNPKTYRCYYPDKCAVDPANRMDCGYMIGQAACLAKGCCFDDTKPNTYECFYGGNSTQTFQSTSPRMFQGTNHN